MMLRRRNLPFGWYPEDAEGVRTIVASWTTQEPPSDGALAAIAPHAGWAFSGRLAARAIASLGEAETIVVIGGHLLAQASPLTAFEDAYETPLGAAPADSDLRSALARELALPENGRLALRSDEVPDNTVEVQLPIIHARFPGSKLLWLRSPNGPNAMLIGKALSKVARALGRKIACIGSTDLTHYGPAYDFIPLGRGPAAEAWVREVNDKAFIDALLSMDAASVLARGSEDQSACSPGAAAAALSFALAEGASRAELLAYATSLDVRRDESFVGYAAIGFY